MANPVNKWAKTHRKKREQRKARRGRPPRNRSLRIRSGPVRCAILTPVFAEGGTERWASDLVRSTPPFIEWRRICILDKKTAYGDLDPLRSAGVSVSHGFRSAEKLSEQVDVIVAWGTVCTRFWSRSSRARLIVVAHGDGRSSFTRSIMSANRTAHLQVCCSRAALPCIAKGVNHRIICNAVDTDRLAPTIPKGQFRSRLGVPPGARVLGYVGRLSWEKNPYGAVATLAALGTEWHLALVGRGEERAAVDQLARARGVRGRVHFVGVRRDVGNVLQDMDALIVPSTQEGFGYVIAEGWAAGVPVFSTHVGAAALWPDCVHQIPNLAPAGPQRDSKALKKRLREQGPFFAAAQVIARALGTADSVARVERGRAVVDNDLSLRVFGTNWAAAIASTVGHIAARQGT